MLYSLAQSRPVYPIQPFPVVSGGLSVPPARTDPTCWSTRILPSQAGLGMPNVPVLQFALFGSVRLSTSCWSICPPFSGGVMALSKASTRALVDMSLLSHGGEVAAVLLGLASVGIASARAPTRAI